MDSWRKYSIIKNLFLKTPSLLPQGLSGAMRAIVTVTKRDIQFSKDCKKDALIIAGNRLCARNVLDNPKVFTLPLPLTIEFVSNADASRYTGFELTVKGA